VLTKSGKSPKGAAPGKQPPRLMKRTETRPSGVQKALPAVYWGYQPNQSRKEGKNVYYSHHRRTVPEAERSRQIAYG
jgi:hypothetical protein